MTDHKDEFTIKDTDPDQLIDPKEATGLTQLEQVLLGLILFFVCLAAILFYSDYQVRLDLLEQLNSCRAVLNLDL